MKPLYDWRRQLGSKGAGKKRNRAAQSDQHGYQERPGDIAGKQEGTGGSIKRDKQSSGKQRILEKLRDLEKRRREKGGGQSPADK